MKSAEEYYNFHSKNYRNKIPWERLNEEQTEFWEDHFQAVLEREKRYAKRRDKDKDD